MLRPLAPGSPKELTGLAAFIETVKPVLPVPALALLVVGLYFVFRNTWRELDEDAHKRRAELLATGTTDYRPLVALVMCALVLTMQEYYGGRIFFDHAIYPLLLPLETHGIPLKLVKYDELWGFAWWSGTRVGGYVFPFVVWRAFFRKDSLLDLGLRTRGFLDHVWIYYVFLGIVIPAALVVSNSPDFANYYPFYKTAYRSWFDFLAWEAMYFAQFFALEMFFRGFWLGVLRRSFGSGAIFAMAVPYCMIHYGKPYLEACGAVVAGIALGSLSMKTKSIYQGFLVHITIAALMDWLSLRNRHCIPLTLWPEAAGGCSETAEARDAIARSVEHVAIPVFIGVLLLGIVLAIRQRRLKAQRI